MILTILLILLTTLIIFITCYFNIQRLRYKLPPGPRPWPVVGHMFTFRPMQFRRFQELAQIYGPIISVWFGPKLLVVVSSSDLAKKIMREHDQEFANRVIINSELNFSRDGMDLTWADYGPNYVKIRKVCTLELFNSKRIEAFKAVREDEVSVMIASIYKNVTGKSEGNHDEGVITLRKYLGETVLNHITRIILGKRFFDTNGEVDGPLGKEFMSLLDEVRKPTELPSLFVKLCNHWLVQQITDEQPKFKDSDDRLGNFVKKIIASEEKGQFIEALLSRKSEYDLSEENIIGVLWDIVIAGKDTVAILVEWAMAELVRHPRVLQKAQYELDNVVGKERIVTEEDFPSLPYIHAIVKEALRVHPPTPLLLPHRAQARVKIGGYDIPKHTTVLVNAWSLGRDPANWPNPLEFRPERFLENDVDVKGNDFRIIPFGAGRRTCPGAQIGLTLATLMLSNLLQHFDWVIPKGVDNIDMSESIGLVVYMKSPIKLVPIPRLPKDMYKQYHSDV